MADSLKIDFRLLRRCRGRRSGGVRRRGSQAGAGACKAARARRPVGLMAKAAAAEKFKGKAKSAMTIVAPAGLSVDRIDRGRHRRRKGTGRDRLCSAGRRRRRQGGGTAARRWLSESARARPDAPRTSPTWRSARGCAATASIATRPRRTTTATRARGDPPDRSGPDPGGRQEGLQGPRRARRRA